MIAPALARCSAAVLAVALGLAASRLTAQIAPKLSPADVRAVLIPRINDGTFLGLATAWREGDLIKTAFAGVTVAGGAPIDPSIRFPLGEAGAVFTAALLANLVVRGEVSLDDLAQRFLPTSIRLPNRNGRAITLGDLAFHRSGLPDVRQTGSRTELEQLTRAVRNAKSQFDIGSRYAYSQLGIDLLGLALARHLRMPLSDAIRSRILSPLGVIEIVPLTPIRIPGRDALGHTASGRPVGATTLRAAGWKGSSLDMVRFATAASDTSNGPLASTFALMMRTRSPGPDPSFPVALGWRLLPLDGRDIYWHDAQDAQGFSAYIAMDPQRQRSVAVLSNTDRAVDAIAGALLLGRIPVISAAPSRPSPSAGPTSSTPRRPRRR